jgi:hypothetical protein
MSTQFGFGASSPLLADQRVDQIQDGDGVIDQLAPLSIDIPDWQIVKNLEDRIDDAKGYWNNPDGFDLYNVRNDNVKMYVGKQLDPRNLYRFNVPYVENQIYITEQAVKAYLTGEIPQPDVAPGDDTPQAKQFASDTEKIMCAHGKKKQVRLQQKVENAVENALNKRLGVLHVCFDPSIGKHGELVTMSLNPDECVIDKNAKQGDNPAFFCHYLKMSANEACGRWKNKRKEILKKLGISIKTRTQGGAEAKYEELEQILDIREVFLTYYDEQYEPHEAVVYYFDDLVLEKDLNPNWLYSTPDKNFLDLPPKPFVPLNFDNDGEHWIDNTSAVEQASKLQLVLNKRGRQFMEVVDKANGVLVLDTYVTDIQKSDATDLTRDPNQIIVINTKNAPGHGQDGLFELPPAQVPPDIFQDKVDIRNQIAALMGAPTDFTGIDDNNDETATQSLLNKNQAAGRQDLYVRAIERFLEEYYNLLYHMMIVWYDEKHYFVYSGGDGEYDYLTMHRDSADPNVAITVKAGSFDKQRLDTLAMNYLKMGYISPLDAYKLTHLPNPQQLYDNFAKFKADPMALARDTLDEVDETKAYMAYMEIMNGKKPPAPDNCTKEFILTLRKIMLRDDFIKSKQQKRKQAFLKFYDEALQSLELRTSLDIMSQEGLQLLEPKQPIQPLPAPQMPGMGAPGMPPAPQPGMGMPPPPMGGQPPAPPMGAMPMQPGAPGMPLPDPNQPAMPNPGNPMQLTPPM